MKDQDKTREQLISELEELRQRVTTLEVAERRYRTIIEKEEVIGQVPVIADITESKQSKEALQKAHDELERRVAERTAELAKANEELAIFRKFADASGQGFSMADLDGHLLYLNPALCRMLDVERPEDRIGQHLSICYAEEANRRGKQEIEPVLMREGQWEGELPLLSRQGKSIPTWQNSFVIRDENGDLLRLAVVISDIRERKAAEEALRASEERFRVTFEEAPLGMVIGEGDGVITKANRAVCRMSGYSQEELIGQHVRDLTHPEDRELSAPLVKRLLDGEIPSFTLQKRYLRKDGQPFWAQATTAAIQGPDGKIAFALGVVDDIDDRKRAEEALRQSERRFRNYFEQGLIGMAVTSVDKRWLEVNDRLCEIVGYSREELHQKSWAELTHPDDLEENCRLFNQLLAGEIEKFIFNKRYVTKGGGIVYATIYTRAFRMDDGMIDHIVVLVEDITARKQAEAALHQSHGELRAIYDGMTDGLLIADIETVRAVRVNSAFCRMLGYSEDELLSLPLYRLHPSEDVPKIREQAAAILQGRASGLDLPFLRKDGSVIYADIVANRIVYHGRPCLISFFRDVTERRQARIALERERRTLKHMLQASDHERQLISYDIHDGLAQALAGAIMQFQIYAHARQANPKDAAKAFDSAMAMLQQGHVETRRLISGVRPPILDESGVVAAIVHLVYDPAFDQGPKIDFRNRVMFKRLAPVLENAIYRIVQEGLTNARNHSQSNKILVALKQRDHRLRIEIRDWGVGFDPRTVHENRFGLEGIRERARLLGGKCDIKSKPGKGTSIVVELPVADQEAE